MDETAEKSEEEPMSSANEYYSREDRRKRSKQRLLPSPHVSDDILDESQRHGKVHQVQFKVSPFVAKVGEETAALFNLSLSQYTKCLLYQNLGIFEPIDRRRKNKKQKGVK
jgi:hypothetical protein